MTRRGSGGGEGEGVGENRHRSPAGQGVGNNNQESSFFRHETGDAAAGHRRQPQRPTTGSSSSSSGSEEDDDDDNDRHHEGQDDDDDDNDEYKNHHHLTKPDYLSDEGDSAAAIDVVEEGFVARFRRKCGEAVNHPRVQLSIVTLIAVNALMMGIGTFDFIKDYPDRERAFELTDRCFLMIFTVELFVQFIYRGSMLLTDGWLVFDLVIIVTSWAFAELQIIRAFRIFRALRLITRVQVMQNLVIALFGVMPRMVAIGLLLFLVSYIFAVMFTQLFKDLYERGKTDADYFGRLDKTFYTLFQIMTFDGWPDIARQVMKVYPWAWLPFVVFVVITSFVVVNLIIAVICDAIAALHDDDKAKLHGQQVATTSATQDAKTLRESLTALEQHVENLTQTQDETLQVMSALVEHLQASMADD